MQSAIRPLFSSIVRSCLTGSFGILFFLALIASGSHPLQAQTFTSIYSFPGGLSGAFPGARSITVTPRGEIIGTTQQGGNQNCNPGAGCGVIYTLSSAGQETVLHAFAGASTDGAEPNPPVYSSSGVLYGTTSSGGVATDACINGCGTFFKIENGSETVLYSFAGSPDANLPLGTPILDPSGNLYTETFYGGGALGETGPGTVAEWTSAGAERLLLSFTTSDGTNPNGSFLRDSAGNFYGSTTYVGTGNCNNGFLPGCGTVFKIDASGAESVLHQFTGGQDGQYPNSLIMDAAGNLYGISGANHFTEVFKIDASGNFSTVYSAFGAQIEEIFFGPANSFFATTLGGNPACTNGCGMVLHLFQNSSGQWTAQTLHRFDGTDGNDPDSLLLISNVLYGTTFQGGASNDGTVFKITF